jgi:CheY-like chemotaxis protein
MLQYRAGWAMQIACVTCETLFAAIAGLLPSTDVRRAKQSNAQSKHPRLYCFPMDAEISRARVLVVDDEKIIADSYALILQLENYDARAVYSAEEALAVLPAFDPKVIVSDIVMGPMSGFDLAIHLAEHYPRSRVILVSGHSFHEPEVERTIKHGFEFLIKPVNPTDLLARISALDESGPNLADAGVRRG